MTGTPLQKAIMLAIPAYKAAARLLDSREERAVLRDVLSAAIAADYVRDLEDGMENDDDGDTESAA